MGFVRFLRDHIWYSFALVIAFAIGAYGTVMDALDLYRNASIPGWFWQLVGLALFFIAVTGSLYRFHRITLPPPSAAPQLAGNTRNSHTKATQTLFEREEIHVWEIPARSEVVIRRRVFKDCIIHGPAIVAFNGCVLEYCGFDVDDIEDALYEVQERRISPGTYQFVNCNFHSCRFVSIGVIGTKLWLEGMRKAIPSKGGAS